MKSRVFGHLPGGQPVLCFTLETGDGASMEVLTLGGIVRSLVVPDRDGRPGDVVLGFDTLAPYLGNHPYFGVIAGRVAGRIPGGSFTLDGRTYRLAQNDGKNHLHGGLHGLDKRLWEAEPVTRPDGADSLRLSYHSPDGEEGYPGVLDISVTFTLSRDHVFIFETATSSDRLTPVSLTHHSYFNLAGEGSGDIRGHELEVFSDRVFAVDEFMTPLNRTEPVAGRGCDFTTPRRLGEAIPHLFQHHGDLYHLPGTGKMIRAARLHEPNSGRMLEVSTNEHCLQFYTGSALDGSLTGKSGHPYARHAGLCLECEGYPGGVDRPEFGNILVRPDQPLRHATRYAFSTFNPIIHQKSR